MAKDRCKTAIQAASEIISEEACDGGQFAKIDIGEGMLVWIPKGSLKFSPHSNPNNREEAIKACMTGPWARSWAEAVVGPGAPGEIIERTTRKLCEGLYK